MGIYKYLISYRITMKKILVLFVPIVFCLIPVWNVYSQDDTLRELAQIPFEPLLADIEDLGDPQASAYLKIRNSDGQLVGVVPVTATNYLDHPILPYFLENFQTVEMVTKGEQAFEMKKIHVGDFYVQNEQCKYDRGFFPCFYYSFSTTMTMVFMVEGTQYQKDAFFGLTHSYIAEEQDTIEAIWTVLYPKN